MPVILINPWSYSYIQQLAREATYDAERDQLRPALALEVITNYARSQRLNIPFLGDYVPADWERANEIEPVFVDTTGRAVQGDQAMPTFEFYRRVMVLPHYSNIGYGVIEVGQTQALVATYYRKEAHGTKQT